MFIFRLTLFLQLAVILYTGGRLANRFWLFACETWNLRSCVGMMQHSSSDPGRWVSVDDHSGF